MFKFEHSGPSLADIAQRIGSAKIEGVSEALAEETLALILDGFLDSVEPSGEAWEPLAIRDGSPLADTGGLRNAWERGTVSAASFEVVNGKEYADFHQRGTGVFGPHKTAIRPVHTVTYSGKGRPALAIPGVGYRASVEGSPARPMVPDGELPQRWAERYDEATAEYFTEILE